MPPKILQLPKEQLPKKEKLPAVYFGKLTNDFCIAVLRMWHNYYEKLRKNDTNNPTAIGNTWNDIFTTKFEPQLDTFKSFKSQQ